MKVVVRRLLSEHGMLGVLILLCGFFSVVTYSDQSLTGEAAAEQVAHDIAASVAKGGQVMIAVRDQPHDAAFAAKLQSNLESKGLTVAAVARGEPQDARAALQGLAARGRTLDAIACNQVTGGWLVFSDLVTDFPQLGQPRVVIPHQYKWPNFLKVENLLNITNQIAVIAIVAIGMTMVIITGGIDLSVGSLIALSAVFATWLIREYGGGTNATAWVMIAACAAAAAGCGLLGGFTGSMITWFGIPPFIVTLAMMLVTSGLAYTLAEGQSIYQVPESFIGLGRGSSLLGIPNAVVLMVVLYIVAHVIMTQTRIGRYLYALGGNREAALISGVPIRRVLLFAYIASGLLAGVGGVIMASQLKSGSPTYGGMYELYVIAAAVVGGASLSGGKGKMFGTLTGAFIIAVIQNGMNLTNVESYTQKIVLGAVILGAVLVDKARR